MMYYTIYKVTNLINGKSYTGKHQTEDPHDSYMGSGFLIRKAIEKYGLENFYKEVIAVYDNEPAMNIAERILVIVDKETSYNLSDGGKGGFSFINRTGLNWSPEKNAKINGFKHLNPDDIRANAIKGGIAARDKTIARNIAGKGLTKDTAHINTDEVINKRNETLRAMGHQKGEKNSQFGKPRSEETKRKISETRKARNKAVKNDFQH